MRQIFLCTPMYKSDCLTDGWAQSIMTASLPGGYVRSGPFACSPPITDTGSLLPSVFNKLWITAICQKSHIFAMIHADVWAEPGWLDELVKILDSRKADIVSASIRIKDNTYDFSVALDLDPKCENPFHLKRLSAKHLSKMPEVFDRHHAAKAIDEEMHEYGPLLVNTGCWVADLRRSWARKIVFQLNSYINWEQDPPKTYTEPEDWSLSRQLHRLGCHAIYGTKRVRTQHLGTMAFDSHVLELEQRDFSGGGTADSPTGILVKP
jgi:hypothetical protein